jgi:tetratricopeptide (TPR) repeat protein
VRKLHSSNPAFGKIPESAAPGKVRMLKGTRKVLLALMISYGIILTAMASILIGTYVYLELQQPWPLVQWSMKQAYKAREGLLYEVFLEDYASAKQCYEKLLDSLSRDNKGNLVDISGKSTAWLSAYSDLLCRYADMCKIAGDLDNCKQAYIGAMHVEGGDLNHKSRALTNLAELAEMEGDRDEAEDLLKRACAYGKDTAVKSGSNLSYRVALHAEDMVPGSRESLDASIHLGVLYAQKGEYEKALPILVSSLRAVKNSIRQQRGAVLSRPLEANPLNCQIHESSLLSVYISEVLWASNKKDEAVKWAQKAYNEGYVYHRSNIEAAKSAQLALLTLIKMEKSLGNKTEVEKYQGLLDKIEVPSKNVTKWDWFKSALL